MSSTRTQSQLCTATSTSLFAQCQFSFKYKKQSQSQSKAKQSQSKYKKLLEENITKTYKNSDQQKVNNVNSHPKRVTEKLPTSDRIEKR